MQEGAIKEGDNVVVIDDLIATGEGPVALSTVVTLLI